MLEINQAIFQLNVKQLIYALKQHSFVYAKNILRHIYFTLDGLHLLWNGLRDLDLIVALFHLLSFSGTNLLFHFDH